MDSEAFLMIGELIIRMTARLIEIAERIQPVDTVKEYSLGEKQRIFVKDTAKLINFAYEHGYEFTYGESHRPPETASLYAKQGRGIKNSLHPLRLAIDFNLFKNGEWLADSKDHEPLGRFWESLSRPGLNHCWGGRFKGPKGPDGNHYSIEHNGIK